MVHWKRDLDLYTIGRPLERNAGFWLDYMKGLKGEPGQPYSYPLYPTYPRRSRPFVPRYPTEPSNWDPALDDPYFWDPIDGVGLPHSPEYDKLRHTIAAARNRVRDRRLRPYC
ncbi:uncharacterized protein LOC122370565 isoform X2 [Amphibalanus amphitrite]|uniref:uncharacterized protein LOC122370565 isoform X2 n=1 Tax=Amphibalanus amphitrite TaxID=1232801 RepID=UPI001C8FCF29|nr:uncharacterized protein LOC122370565 isoform X2 [Amphibalanus amphitrite]